jgi:two-component system sensor kinase FixL
MDTDSDGSPAPQRPKPRWRQAMCHADQGRRWHAEDVEPRPHLTANSLWEFAALAHELKQPLAAILSNAQAAWNLLSLDTLDQAEMRACLADIIADARRTDEVLRGLQAFVTTGALDFALLNINDIAQETIGLVHSDATARGVSITLDLADDLPRVYGDHIQLRQVLLNLVRNAFEAMRQVEDGGRVLVVRTSSATPESRAITVEVQDRGIGVDETTMARLFHPFFTTKAGGMGLGLAFSRSIIAAHGGWIWATQNPDRGLTISFTLPAV